MHVCGCTTPCATTRETASCDQILDGLFLGAVEMAFNAEKLTALGITHVVDLSGSAYTPRTGITYIRRPIADEPDADLLGVLEPCLKFIAQAKSNVLVCCAMGISRSAAVVTAHVMLTQRLGRDAALALVAAKRPRVAPNSGFMKQLLEFEAQLQPSEPTVQEASAASSVRT